MSAEAAILSRSWRVGTRSCTLSMPPLQPGKPLHACIEWRPSPPRALSIDEWHEYRTGRDSAISEIANALGITVAVLEPRPP